MYKIKNIGLAAIAMMMATAFVSCGDNYPDSMDAPYDTDLLGIKIMNAGAKGDQVVEGRIDEEKKEVEIPIITRIKDNELIFDMRTLRTREFDLVKQALIEVVK